MCPRDAFCDCAGWIAAVFLRRLFGKRALASDRFRMNNGLGIRLVHYGAARCRFLAKIPVRAALRVQGSSQTYFSEDATKWSAKRPPARAQLSEAQVRTWSRPTSAICPNAELLSRDQCNAAADALIAVTPIGRKQWKSFAYSQKSWAVKNYGLFRAVIVRVGIGCADHLLIEGTLKPRSAIGDAPEMTDAARALSLLAI